MQTLYVGLVFLMMVVLPLLISLRSRIDVDGLGSFRENR